MKKILAVILLLSSYSFAQQSKIINERIEPFKEILIVSQSEISNYRYEGLKKEFIKYGYFIRCKNLTKSELSLEPDSVLYNDAIKQFKPEILFIISKKGEENSFGFYNSLLNTYDVWNYEVRDIRTKKVIYKAIFKDFNFKKILKTFEKDGLISKIN